MALPAVEARKILQSSKPLKTVIETAVLGHIVLRGLYWRVLLGLIVVPKTRNKNDDDEEYILDSWVTATMKLRERFYNRHGREQEKNKAAHDEENSALKKKKTKFGDSSSDDEDQSLSVKATPNGGLYVKDYSADDPLSNSDTNPYALSYKRQKLAACIDQDMERLWSDDPFFEDEKCIREIRTVLLLYCEEENEIGYRQGMNEIAAFIVYILYQDIETVENRLGNRTEDPLSCALRKICSAEHVSADAYWIFKTIMGEEGMNLSSWYQVNTVDTTNSTGRSAPPNYSNVSLKGDSGMKKSLFDETEITFVAGLVQDVMLPMSDDELSKHLKGLDIHAPTYCIRWLRLLFIREFSIMQTAKLWDGILAEYCYISKLVVKEKDSSEYSLSSSGTGPSGEICHSREYRINQSIILHIGVVMLEYIRNELLESDFSYALRKLMKYPPVDDTRVFLQRSIFRKYQGTPLAAMAGLLSGNVGIKTSAVSSAVPSRAIPLRTVHNVTLPPSLVEPSSGESSRQIIEALINKQTRMGVALSTVMTSLERKWFKEEVHSESERENLENDYLVAIAQLKKIRDVLMNLVPDE
eukprot:Tbor_TRINITY_DN410_c0_g1::TRINITY_DN410_c0_g1_i1::g.3182::m.3182/K18469/TBC1D5; TBC1 domain family member 5